jgi:hypothetical protein
LISAILFFCFIVLFILKIEGSLKTHALYGFTREKSKSVIEKSKSVIVGLKSVIVRLKSVIVSVVSNCYYNEKTSLNSLNSLNF